MLLSIVFKLVLDILASIHLSAHCAQVEEEQGVPPARTSAGEAEPGVVTAWSPSYQLV